VSGAHCRGFKSFDRTQTRKKAGLFVAHPSSRRGHTDDLNSTQGLAGLAQSDLCGLPRAQRLAPKHLLPVGGRHTWAAGCSVMASVPEEPRGRSGLCHTAAGSVMTMAAREC